MTRGTRVHVKGQRGKRYRGVVERDDDLHSVYVAFDDGSAGTYPRDQLIVDEIRVRASKVWNVFLPIGTALKTDTVAGADTHWLASHGIEGDAFLVLRRVRDDVLPLVRTLEQKRRLASFSFLVHDRTSGVPTTPEDPTAYLHLRLTFTVLQTLRAVRARLPAPWVFHTPVKPSSDEAKAHRLLDPQSAWYLSLIEAHRHLPDRELLQTVRQFLHYFANMAQMRIS